MKNKKFWKIISGVGLSVLLILPSPGLGNTKSVKDTELTDYSKLGAKYLNDCGNLDKEARPSDEKLKRCITLIKELRDKYDGFLQKLDSIREKLRGENKWTAELDGEFEKNASKVDADTRSEVKRKGGFRSFYQTSTSELKRSKHEFDTEIKALERKQIKISPSSVNQSFQIISYSFGTADNQVSTTEGAVSTAAAPNFAGNLIGKVARIVSAICTAVSLC